MKLHQIICNFSWDRYSGCRLMNFICKGKKKDYSHLKLFFLLCVFRTLTITSLSYSRLIGNVKWFMIMNNLDCNTNQVTLTFHSFIAVTERQQQVDGSFLRFLVTNVQTCTKRQCLSKTKKCFFLSIKYIHVPKHTWIIHRPCLFEVVQHIKYENIFREAKFF